jgi:hypothetical protein
MDYGKIPLPQGISEVMAFFSGDSSENKRFQVMVSINLMWDSLEKGTMECKSTVPYYALWGYGFCCSWVKALQPSSM